MSQTFLTLRNSQHTRRVNLRHLRAIARDLLERQLSIGAYDLAIHLVAAPEMTRLNEAYLRHAGSTDVITFDYSAGQGSGDPFPSPHGENSPKQFAHCSPESPLRKPTAKDSPSPWGEGWGEGELGPESQNRLRIASPTPSPPPAPFSLLPSSFSRPFHGEIFICVDEAVTQARRFRTTWQSELIRYLIHGILHLQGFDDLRPADRRRMKREESRLLRRCCQLFELRQLTKKIGDD